MRTLREHLLVIALFLLLVFLFALPFSVHMHDHVLAIPVDNLLNTYFMAWDVHALVTNPTALFQANFNYPSRDTLAFSEHLFTLGVLSLPIRLVTRNPVLAHNLILLICFALCGYTMYLLTRYLTGSSAAALVGGFFYTFVPYHFSTIVHAHVTLYFLQPLVLFFLIRYLEGGGKRFLLGFGLAFLAQALFSWYQLAFSTIPVGFYLLWRLLSIRGWRQLASLLGASLVLAACLACVIPFALPYLRLRDNVLEGESRPAENPVLEARPSDFRRVIDENLLYARTGFLNKGHIGEGNALFPGFVVLPLVFLSFLSLFLGKRGCNRLLRETTGGCPSEAGGFMEPESAEDACDLPLPPETDKLPPERMPAARNVHEGMKASPSKPPSGLRKKPGCYIVYFIFLAAFCFVLSMGRVIAGRENLLFKYLHRLPIYSLVRFPIRYHIVVVLSLSALAAYGTAWLSRLFQSRGWHRTSFLFPCAVLALMFVEFSTLFMPFERVPVGKEVPQVYRDLAQMERGVVLEAPTPLAVNFPDYEDPLIIDYGMVENALKAAFREQLAMYFSTYHWQRLVNGMSGYYPLFYRRVLAEMLSFPSDRSLSFLRALGVRYLVLHWDYYPGRKGEEVRSLLEGLPGVSLLRDYPPDISLYLLEAVETLPPSELEGRVFCPAAVGPGSAFRASLGLSNRSGLPCISTDEYRMHLRLSWTDAEGREALSEEVYYYFPFYLHPGEQKVAGFSARAPREQGRYELSVTASDGPLEGREWRVSVTVGEVPSAPGGEGLAGILSLDLPALQEKTFLAGRVDGGQAGEIVLRLDAGELFSLPVAAENRGSALWERDLPERVGRVEVTAIWDPEEAPEARVVQHGLLPCDLAPGQRETFSVALQAPSIPGDYRLLLGLNRLCVAQVGEPVAVRVEVR